MTGPSVLLTGTRSPAALDLGRSFAAAGWRVVGAEYVRWPVSRLSRAFAVHHRLPSARAGHAAFADRLEQVIQAEQITLLVPTCEEIFFVARHRERLSRLCRVACPDFAALRRLHDKAALPEIAGGLGLGVPETLRVETAPSVRQAVARLEGDVVLKPAFSRFAARTLLLPDKHAVEALRPSREDPWVCQRFVRGEEVCLYAVAVEGRLTAVSAYRPRHRMGVGAGIYFEPVQVPDLEAFAAAFVARHHLSGQVAFDVIQDPHGAWWVIECNPRATSGVHLFGGEAALAEAFGGGALGGGAFGGGACVRATEARPQMVGLAMALLGLPRAVRAGRLGPALADMRRAGDVVARPGDRGPGVAQWAALLETLALALRHRCAPRAATTIDCEWNGEPLT